MRKDRFRTAVFRVIYMITMTTTVAHWSHCTESACSAYSSHKATLLDQLRMAAALKTGVVEHDDHVGRPNRGEPVRYQHGNRAPIEPCRGRLPRTVQKRACSVCASRLAVGSSRKISSGSARTTPDQRDFCPLTGRHIDAAASGHRVGCQTRRECIRQVGGAGLSSADRTAIGSASLESSPMPTAWPAANSNRRILECRPNIRVRD